MINHQVEKNCWRRKYSHKSLEFCLLLNADVIGGGESSNELGKIAED
jgi:hypothetical protein